MGVTLALMLAACSSGGGSGNGASTGTTTGKITFALDETIPGWNINTSADTEFVLQEITNLVSPQPFIINSKLLPVLNTQLLESATQTSTSPQTIVYKINPAAKWSDGVPISADDFIYNWQAQSGLSQYTDVGGKAFDDASNTGYNQIKSVTSSDGGKTVTAVFSTPFADWRSLFANLIPAHIAKTVGWNTGFNDIKNLISGSWYEVSSYQKDQFLILKRNPHYWSTPGKLATITFQIFNGDDQAVPAMQNGEVQIINPLEVSLPIVQSAAQLTNVTQSLEPGLEFQHFDFNESDPYLAMLPVRQAIAYGTDRKAIIARTIGEFAKGSQPLGNRMLVPGQTGFVNNGAAYDNVNVAKAKSLLESAGMKMGSDGYYQPTSGPQAGKDLTFTINSTTGNDLRSNIEQLWQSQMKTIGIKILIANQDANQLFGTTLIQGTFQITLFAWVSTPFLSGNQSIYCSYTNGSACGQNWDHYANAAVDKDLRDGAQAATPAQETAAYNAADKQLWADMVTLPLFQDPILFVWSNKYTGIVPNGSSVGITWNANLWALKS
ncbi:MAG TPA: ABC transporter family substrate-binding protein [Acidimicrobiales bacterium]|nr:ABC transporter family substrate-binding protein [Acidimicrobiales bacterium]